MNESSAPNKQKQKVYGMIFVMENLPEYASSFRDKEAN